MPCGEKYRELRKMQCIVNINYWKAIESIQRFVLLPQEQMC